MIDQTITIGNIIEISVIVGSGLILLIKNSNRFTTLSEDMKYVKDKVKSINELVTARAVFETRLAAAEQDIRELRHGDGFVRNVLPSRPGVNKEYP